MLRVKTRVGKAEGCIMTDMVNPILVPISPGDKTHQVNAIAKAQHCRS